MIQVFHISALRERREVEEIGTVRVNEGVEAQSGAPWIGEVHDVHVWVAVSLSLAPQQQSIFGSFLFTQIVIFVL